MIPARQPGQSFFDHQAEMAEWLGCSVAQMNAEHDLLHERLAKWLGLPSQALRIAAGLPITEEQIQLAGLEEEAVLYLQRYLVWASSQRH